MGFLCSSSALALLALFLIANMNMNMNLIAAEFTERCYCPSRFGASVLCSLSDIKVITKPVKPDLYTVTVTNSCAYCSANWISVESSHPGYPTIIKDLGGTLKPKEVYTTAPIFGNPSLPHPATQVNYICVV